MKFILINREEFKEAEISRFDTEKKLKRLLDYIWSNTNTFSKLMSWEWVVLRTKILYDSSFEWKMKWELVCDKPNDKNNYRNRMSESILNNVVNSWWWSK